MLAILGAILSGNSQQHIGEALASTVTWIDAALLIDTGITDGTRRVAEELLGERLVVEEFPWCNDFAKARNFALEAAAGHGATWAMTLDTDERMEFPGYRSAEELLAAIESDPQVLVWLVMEKGGRYAKERFVRVAARGQRAEARGQEEIGPHPGPLPRGEGEGGGGGKPQGADAPRSPLRWVGR